MNGDIRFRSFTVDSRCKFYYSSQKVRLWRCTEKRIKINFWDTKNLYAYIFFLLFVGKSLTILQSEIIDWIFIKGQIFLVQVLTPVLFFRSGSSQLISLKFKQNMLPTEKKKNLWSFQEITSTSFLGGRGRIKYDRKLAVMKIVINIHGFASWPWIFFSLLKKSVWILKWNASPLKIHRSPWN